LHHLALAARSIRRQRTEQAFDQKAEQGGSGQRRILVGQMAAGTRGRDAQGEFGRKRFAKFEPLGVKFGIDRLGNGREGQPAVAQRAHGEGHDHG
jgi:hypothetical protein